jgi:hypothetical protein
MGWGEPPENKSWLRPSIHAVAVAGYCTRRTVCEDDRMKHCQDLYRLLVFDAILIVVGKHTDV